MKFCLSLIQNVGLYPSCTIEWVMQIDWLELPDYNFCLNILSFFQVSIRPPLHTGIFYRNSLLLPRCAVFGIPAVRGLCPISNVFPPAAVPMLRILLQERRCDWPCPFLLIRQMQAFLQSRAGGCSSQPAVLLSVLFQLCVNSTFL